MNRTGLFVTAAFIGPGTITTASIAGANFGFALLWALAFSIIATYILQEMTSRLGLVTGMGLAESLRQSVSQPLLRNSLLALVVAAIGIGNAAYQGGNLTGAALGLSNLAGGSLSLWVVTLGAIASLILYRARYRLIETALMVLVAIMGMVFIVTMLYASPDLGSVLAGLFSFSIPDGASLTVIALIGTTIVPYNLFLHASLAARAQVQISDIDAALKHNRRDAALSIGLGGLITLAVMSCAVSAFFITGSELNAANLAVQLAPLLGDYASGFFALGLLAAGLTSAITAPLAAAYAVCGALGWSADMRARHFRLVWGLVMVSGILFAATSVKPLIAIQFAQAANGLLLPIVALLLLWMMNRKVLLRDYTNRLGHNLLAAAIVAVVTALSATKLIQLLF